MSMFAQALVTVALACIALDTGFPNLLHWLESVHSAHSSWAKLILLEAKAVRGGEKLPELVYYHNSHHVPYSRLLAGRFPSYPLRETISHGDCSYLLPASEVREYRLQYDMTVVSVETYLHLPGSFAVFARRM